MKHNIRDRNELRQMVLRKLGNVSGEDMKEMNGVAIEILWREE